MSYVTLLAVVNFAQFLSVTISVCPSISGISTYNISVLPDINFITQYNNLTFYINICGKSPACQGDISACYYNGSTKVELGTAATTLAEGYRDYLNVTLQQDTLVTHMTLLCGTTLGRPEVQLVSSTSVNIVWETLAGCQNVDYSSPQVPCYTYDSETRQLYDLGDLVGVNYHIPMSETLAVYFSICGAVSGDHSCEGGAACNQHANTNTNIGNIGHGPSVTEDGVILGYVNQDRDSTTCPEITTTVLLRCSPHEQTPPVLLALLDRPCSYNILWHTDYACPIVPVHDTGCKLQARGRNYDLTPLMVIEYKVEDAEHTYQLAVCRNMEIQCSGTYSSGCIISKTTYKGWSMGTYHEGNLIWDDTGLTMIYNGGTSCSSGQVRSTKILFVCDKSVGIGQPEMAGEAYCFYSFIWRTKYACPLQQEPACAKYGTDGELYDLSILSQQTWIPMSLTGTQDLIFSLCGEMRECPGASLCRRNVSGMYEVLASHTQHFSVYADKSLQLTYEGDGVCTAQSTSLVVEMTCKQGSLITPPILISSQPCNYAISWATGAACPAHAMTGTDCKIHDDVTGLTFDVTGLADMAYNISDEGNTTTVMSLQLCGNLTSSPCGEGVSVCTPDGINIGYTSQNLIYEDNQLAMAFIGGDCMGGQYITIVEFVCDTNKRERWAHKLTNCAYYVSWSDPTVCPMYPMECVAFNKTHSFDLSPLYDLGDLEWAGLLNNTQTAVFLRVCGQVTPGTRGCDHTAGVCAVIEVDGVERALNLGRSSSELTVTGSVISEVYRNGDNVCSDGKKEAMTRVEYRCSKEDETTKIVSVLFNDELCMYMVVVSSRYGCTEQPVTSTNCSVLDPFTGTTYDFSFLQDDYVFNNANSHFSLHVCGALTAPCGDNINSAGCEVVNGNQFSLGVASTSTLTLDDGVFTLSYTGGDECVEGKDSEVYKQTQITMRCNKDVKTGQFKYINKDSESCVYHFEWELAAACPPLELSCRVIDAQLKEYDLSILKRDVPWMMRSDKLYYLNVCGAAHLCGEGVAICSIEGADNKITSLGRVSGEPQVTKDGVIELSYYHGDECNHGNRHWTTTILFICEEESETMPSISVNYETCQVTVTWRTLHACPALYLTGDNCTLTNTNTGVVYDLWKLSHKDYSVATTEHAYKYSICRPLQEPCNGDTDAGTCQTTLATGGQKNNGDVNTTVTYSSGVVILQYKGGDVCSRGDVRQTTINMVCDHSLTELDLLFDTVNETSHCIYEAFAFSGLPCDKEVLSQCEIEGYDITALALTRGNYIQQLNGSYTITMNVCRGVNKPAPCDGGTAVCLRGHVEKGISLGKVSSALLVYEDDILKLKYSGADICPSTGQPYRAIITLLCAQDDIIGVPQYLSNTTCVYNFLWNTKYACKGRIVSTGCKIVDTVSGNTIHDLSSIAGSYTAKGKTGEYSLQICGKLSGSPCKADSAVCFVDSSDKAHSLGLLTSETKLETGGEDSPITLTYGAGEVCTKADGTTVPYTTVIEFVCSPSDEKKASLAYELDCVVYFSFSTLLVCYEEKMSCEIIKNSKTIDLSSLSSNMPEYIVSNKIYLDGYIHLSVCSSLPHVGVTQGCPAHSASCLIPSNSKDTPVDIGHLTAPLALNGDGDVELVYGGGVACKLADGSDSSTQTRITFKCDKASVGTVPYLVDQLPCEYQILWKTNLVCTDVTPTPVKSCKISDPDTGYLYDLTRLTRLRDFYTVTSGNSRYTLNVCGTVDKCKTGAAVCLTEDDKAVSLGDISTVTTQLAQEDGEVELSYSGGDVCEISDQKRQTKILIMCCSEEDNPLSLITTDECTYYFTLCSPKVCQFNPKECSFKIGDNAYDFSALARRYDNWKVKDGDMTYYLNPCRGVNMKQIPQKGCAENSIACLTEAGVGESRSLGLVETRVHNQLPAPSDILLSYGSGAESLCTGRTAKTAIIFECGNTLGSPTFYTKDSQGCTYKFQWTSYVACNATARPVTSSSCTYEHPLTHLSVDLTAVSDTYHTVQTPRGVIYFTSCDKTLPKDIESGGCYKKSVCYRDGTNGHIVSFTATHKEVFARDESVELELRSDVKCEDSESKTWAAMIEYTCSTDRTTSAYYRTLAHCHILIGVKTPLVCSEYRPEHHHTMLLMILLASGVFAILLCVAFCSSKNRRETFLRRVRSLIPVRGAHSTRLAYTRVEVDMNDTRGALACDF